MVVLAPACFCIAKCRLTVDELLPRWIARHVLMGYGRGCQRLTPDRCQVCSPRLNPQADEPQSPVVDGGVPRLLLGYCRDGNSSDVMIPDTAEGDIFWRRKQRAAYRPVCRAGKWYGRCAV